MLRGVTSQDPRAPATHLRPLRKRPEFLALNKAMRIPAGGFLLQARDRQDGDPSLGIGFTCSRKVGNAVTRNRAKRRLRAAARIILPDHGQPGWDYALIGRRAQTVDRPFSTLLTDLRHALARVHS